MGSGDWRKENATFLIFLIRKMRDKIVIFFKNNNDTNLNVFHNTIFFFFRTAGFFFKIFPWGKGHLLN